MHWLCQHICELNNTVCSHKDKKKNGYKSCCKSNKLEKMLRIKMSNTQGTAIVQGTYLDTDVSFEFLHLPQTGRDERGLATAHRAHHSHQRSFLHSHVDAATVQHMTNVDSTTVQHTISDLCIKLLEILSSHSFDSATVQHTISDLCIKLLEILSSHSYDSATVQHTISDLCIKLLGILSSHSFDAGTVRHTISDLCIKLLGILSSCSFDAGTVQHFISDLCIKLLEILSSHSFDTGTVQHTSNYNPCPPFNMLKQSSDYTAPIGKTKDSEKHLKLHMCAMWHFYCILTCTQANHPISLTSTPGVTVTELNIGSNEDVKGKANDCW